MAEAMIEMRGLTKRYGSVTAVDDLSLKINAGEIFGLLGPNGAGKTTTTLMLLGLSEPTGGTATISGINCTRDPIRVKRIVGYLPDNTGFYPDLTGRENLRLIGRMNGVADDVIDKRMDALLERVGMAQSADRKAGTYSKGMKQRLGIADILMKEPDVLIMDEPTSGIDPEGMRELMKLIRQLAAQDGKTILISSHQLYQIQQICDRVGIFVEGKLIACGRIDELGEQLEREKGFVTELGVDPTDERLEALIKEIKSVQKTEREGELLIVESSADIRGDIVKRLTAENYTVTHLRQRGGDLDAIYARYFEKAGEKDASGDNTKSALKARKR